MQALKSIGLFITGILFGIVIDVVSYNLVEGMVCMPDFPSTCFVTQHAAFRPLIHGLLLLNPFATCAMFLMLQSGERVQRVAHVSLAVLVSLVIALAVCANFIRPQYRALG